MEDKRDVCELTDEQQMTFTQEIADAVVDVIDRWINKGDMSHDYVLRGLAGACVAVILAEVDAVLEDNRDDPKVHASALVFMTTIRTFRRYFERVVTQWSNSQLAALLTDPQVADHLREKLGHTGSLELCATCGARDYCPVAVKASQSTSDSPVSVDEPSATVDCDAPVTD